MKTVTEREAVLRERAAWVAGVQAELRRSLDAQAPEKSLMREATERYPLPKVERPRVVTDAKGHGWRLVDRKLEIRTSMGVGWSLVGNALTDGRCSVIDPVSFGPASLRAIADLLDNPIELVED